MSYDYSVMCLFIVQKKRKRKRKKKIDIKSEKIKEKKIKLLVFKCFIILVIGSIDNFLYLIYLLVLKMWESFFNFQSVKYNIQGQI